MMLELAVGDAYGAGFEYIDEPIVKKYNDLSTYVKHSRLNIGGGRYTDDTQMSLAIAELLADGKPLTPLKEAWTPLNIADKFVDVFKRDQRVGYAQKFHEFLQTVNTGEEFLERIIPESDRSGAAMRASPIGFLPNVNDVILFATTQAKLTHNTTLGVDAAVASALMSHYFIRDFGKKEDLGIFINYHVPGDWDVPWTGRVREKGYMSVRAAITAIKEHDTLSGILKRAVDFTGDVDTVATIALAAASCSKEIKQDLPQNLIDNLENNAYGRDYLIGLDMRLRRKFLKYVK